VMGRQITSQGPLNSEVSSIGSPERAGEIR
jgi:hypothetical protein